ncbi:hypothetical protein EYC84_007062 [Monilinia fructicola]|uniref:Yeast cell wall synthesis Kre9/Knh1-like N-terminal domain-containing protein n=1 Tax=Monilinia fructicola TaxID=38448 RepID=A0A5M9K853_MONFR|nr:hypothetical protein EYC84_007062 [Monilinia fructicola]
MHTKAIGLPTLSLLSSDIFSTQELRYPPSGLSTTHTLLKSLQALPTYTLSKFLYLIFSLLDNVIQDLFPHHICGCGLCLFLTWSSVDTDPSQFSIYLVNFKDWPPTVVSLAQNVPQEDKSIDVTIPCNLRSDYGWQINFINGTNTYVIYAQFKPSPSPDHVSTPRQLLPSPFLPLLNISTLPLLPITT